MHYQEVNQDMLTATSVINSGPILIDISASSMTGQFSHLAYQVVPRYLSISCAAQVL
jgi:hypothetical protein